MQPAAQRTIALVGLIAALVVARPVPAGADEGAPIPLRIQVIAASRSPGGMDPRLEGLRGRLEDFAFASYRMVDEKNVRVDLKASTTVVLPGGRTLDITPREFDASGKLRVHLNVRGPRQKSLVDAEYAIELGGDLLVGGMKHEDGALLVAIHHGRGGARR